MDRAAAVSNGATYQPPQPITITSEYAEIIYFLRNGNLYRRVLLVAPALQSTIEPSVANVNPNFNPAGFFPVALGGNQVSWQAVNDLSAHPATTGAPYQGNSVILNALGDLTNRENRFAYQRFSSDFQNLAGRWSRAATACPTTSTATTCRTITRRSIPAFYLLLLAVRGLP